MPIIYIKNPTSGSHFRNIGGTKGGRPIRGGQKRFRTDRHGIRSVGWASCSKPKATNWPHYSFTAPRHGGFPTAIAGAIFAFLGITSSTTRNDTADTFSKPCR